MASGNTVHKGIPIAMQLSIKEGVNQIVIF